ncbi:hypothetical protein GGR53DRAFT_466520 [Hypoxylon sp. FL1150]|nr:hypothetical protein GGR53DRAFT_466520 [Hypoxylon sp. FL1150]
MKLAVFLSAITGALGSVSTLWAQFCDDTACNENCGLSVDVRDPGCLSPEHNRKSIKFHGDTFPEHFLVFSPGTDCNCQNDCIDIDYEPSCIDISRNAAALSFRFQEVTCHAHQGGPAGVGNNCPTEFIAGNHTASPF